MLLISKSFNSYKTLKNKKHIYMYIHVYTNLYNWGRKVSELGPSLYLKLLYLTLSK